MRARCNILANRISTGAMRCPSGLLKFHYHGVASGPIVHVMTGVAPCAHRHDSQDAAERCTDLANGNRPPVRLAAIARQRAQHRARTTV